jgi:hypothetical protein
MFSTNVMKSEPVRVDRKANVIFGAALMQTGDLNDGDARPWTVDAKTLAQAEQFAKRSKNGIKARFTHPNMSSDGMGSYLGRWKNVRVDGDTLRGDLHIADAAFSSPQGDLGTYVMDLAESDPEAFGVSLATRLDQDDLQSFERKQRDAEEGGAKWPMRFSDVRAGDIVDEPAATRGGLFDLTTPDLRNLPAQATALLSTYFGDAPEPVVRGRINSFLDKYFATREGFDMEDTSETAAADLQQTESVETEVVTEPVADLSAAETGDVTTDFTTEAVTYVSSDPAAQERTRCKKIRALCELAGVPEKFNTFVDAEFSVAEVQSALKGIVAKRNPMLSEEPAPEQTPDAKYRAEYQANKSLFTVTEEQYVASRRVDDGLDRLI